MSTAKYNFDDSDEEGTRHFMVNVVEPQFNLHSEEANVSSETITIYVRYLKLFLGKHLEGFLQSLSHRDQHMVGPIPPIVYNLCR